MQNLDLVGSTKTQAILPQPNLLNHNISSIFDEVKRSNETSNRIDSTPRDTEFNHAFSFMTNSVRKTSLSDETCSTHSSSSQVTPPWSSSSVSHSPTPVEQLTKPTLTSNSRPKSFHNILNLIDNKEDSSEMTREEEGFDQPSIIQAPLPSPFDESIRLVSF